jgi:hypothetical protein
MRTGYLSSWAALTLVLATANSLPVAAEESGHWHGLSVLVATDKKVAKVEDRADHMIYVTEYDGAVYNGDGKPFLDKARYQVVALVDTAVSRGGYKTFTDADGSKVFAKYAVTEVKMPDVRGTFEFTGGTGKYEGITGNGTFHDVFVSDKAAWDELVGDYKIPTAVAGTASKN